MEVVDDKFVEIHAKFDKIQGEIVGSESKSGLATIASQPIQLL